jgi:hypothetical protein
MEATKCAVRELNPRPPARHGESSCPWTFAGDRLTRAYRPRTSASVSVSRTPRLFSSTPSATGSQRSSGTSQKSSSIALEGERPVDVSTFDHDRGISPADALGLLVLHRVVIEAGDDLHRRPTALGWERLR